MFNTNVSILILLDYLFLYSRVLTSGHATDGFNPYFIGLPILILVEHGMMLQNYLQGFNPYFIGLPILI